MVKDMQAEDSPSDRGQDEPSASFDLGRDRQMSNADPIDGFASWMNEAKQTGMSDPNAMTLATVDAEGQPSARVVLLKDFDERGFVFYTNLLSRKGQQLQQIARAALVFFWREMGRQVRIEGRVEAVADEDADAYFATRARGSQIGAWASKQSQPLESRQVLLSAVEEKKAEFDQQRVPRPTHWSGFRVVPQRIEFWQAGEFRLHDRWEFTRPEPDAPWTITRLYP